MRGLPQLRRPVLEIGCGDGMFTERAGLRVDHAIDRERRAVERAGRRGAVYGAVTRGDVRELGSDLGRFGTIFANSVLEHVPELDAVLERCAALLEPGGQLITTVPLLSMNEHLALGGAGYAHARQRQLQHRNLWTVPEWTRRLEAAGFAAVEAHPYLDATACRRWDRLDAIGAVGTGRYRVAPVLHRLASVGLPESIKHRLKARLSTRLVAWTRAPAEPPFCAALLVATASA